MLAAVPETTITAILHPEPPCIFCTLTAAERLKLQSEKWVYEVHLALPLSLS